MVTVELNQGMLIILGVVAITLILLTLLVVEYASNRKTRKKVNKLVQEELADPFNKHFLLQRALSKRGGRGKHGIQPLKWVNVQNMSNSWLENCIKYNEERGHGEEYATTLYRTELEFRNHYDIFIEEEEEFLYQSEFEAIMIWLKEDYSARGRSAAARKITESWEKIVGIQRARLLMDDSDIKDLENDD